LCKYRATMQWPSTISFPFNAGFVARERMPIRHYPHRDPIQLARRCRLRAIMMADKENRSNWSRPELHHWAEAEWQKFVTADDDPAIRFWEPGTELPRYSFQNHLAPVPTRIAQRIAHRFALPLLDSMRPGWSSQSEPQPIPKEISELLAEQL
jgi:hypothetical protein